MRSPDSPTALHKLTGSLLWGLLLVLVCLGSASSDANTAPPGQLVASFVYNPSGLRIEKQGERGVERFTYDEQSLLQAYDENNTTLAKYDYGAERLVSLTSSSEPVQFYLTDALNSVVNLTNTAGSVQARYQYDAFGNQRAQSGSSYNRFAFTGYVEDKETDLLYAKARYYDSDTGRFLSQDAWEGQNDLPPSLHKYLYAYQNPTVYVDPDGNEPVSAYLAWSAVNAGVNTGIDYGFYRAFGREGEEFNVGTNYAANYGISVATGGVGAYLKHAPKVKRVGETAVEFSGEVAKEYTLRRDEGASLTQASADTAISMTIGKAAADRIAKAAKPHLETAQESVGSLLQKAKDKLKLNAEDTGGVGAKKINAGLIGDKKLEAQALQIQGLSRSEAFDQMRRFDSGETDGYLFHFTNRKDAKSIVDSKQVYSKSPGFFDKGLFASTIPNPNIFQKVLPVVGHGTPGKNVRIPLRDGLEMGESAAPPKLNIPPKTIVIKNDEKPIRLEPKKDKFDDEERD